MTRHTVWVLTEEYNAYDQFGEYFLAVFSSKPTEGQLTKAGVSPGDVAHVLQGGGRVKYEDQWHILKEHEVDPLR